MKKGFTLIELLVVVLIIAIPAAIALPRYNKAVEKSRAAEAFLNGKALNKAYKIWLLTDDSLPDRSQSDLDFSWESKTDSVCPRSTCRFLKNFSYELDHDKKIVTVRSVFNTGDNEANSCYFHFFTDGSNPKCFAGTEKAKQT